jgi:membrane-associated phospholipid phosphatase
MCCATIYLRYHYLIDVLAAFIYAPAAYLLNDFLLARWPGERIAKPPTPEQIPAQQPIPAFPRTQS